MSCLTCSNCGFINFLPPEPQSQILKTIQSSDSLVSHFLRGSRPLLDSMMKDEIAKLEQLRSLYDAQLQEIQLRQYPILKALVKSEVDLCPHPQSPPGHSHRNLPFCLRHLVARTGAKRTKKGLPPRTRTLWSKCVGASLGFRSRLWALEKYVTHLSSILGSEYLSEGPFLQARPRDMADICQPRRRTSSQYTYHLRERQVDRRQ
ncbi:hypothetical protein EDD85DRAFT_847080 [Armillaria nabsnona]|nr:hypothetical protein EDD85DRAFT_847080 [Armillaria nabsnona]